MNPKIEIMKSDVTILPPRDPHFATTSRISTSSIFMEWGAGIDRMKWNSRIGFFIHALAFNLSLPNLWRFPMQAFVHGQGAFVWIYIFLMLTIGNALLFFELSLGEVFGFKRVFNICPFFEGINYSMAMYCLIVSVYYSILNVYSLVYVFGSVNSTATFATCSLFGVHYPPSVCLENSPNQSLAPESVIFSHTIVCYLKLDEELANDYNWRNIGLLFLVWVCLCIVSLKGIRNSRWVAPMHCVILYITLLLVICTSLSLTGSNNGLNAMFKPSFSDLLDFQVWRYAFEQTILSLGLGMGPLIVLGACAKSSTVTQVDCLLLCIAILVCSLLSGCIFFEAAGIVAHDRNQTLKTVFMENGTYDYFKLSTHVVFSQLFTRSRTVIGHIGAVLFYVTLVFAGWQSLIFYTEVLIKTVYNVYFESYKHKVLETVTICLTCFVLGISITDWTGYKIFMILDRHLVQFGLASILLCEFIAVAYFYGLNSFCQDIEGLIEIKPNFVYRIIWFSASILMTCTLVLFYLDYTYMTNKTEKVTLGVGIVLMNSPILITAIWNCIISYRFGVVKDVFSSRQVTN